MPFRLRGSRSWQTTIFTVFVSVGLDTSNCFRVARVRLRSCMVWPCRAKGLECARRRITLQSILNPWRRDAGNKGQIDGLFPSSASSRPDTVLWLCTPVSGLRARGWRTANEISLAADLVDKSLAALLGLLGLGLTLDRLC